MQKNNLFTLRGILPAQSRVLLSIVGVALLFLFWFLAAEFLSQSLVTQDDTIELQRLSVANRLYYESDSLLIAEYDR